MNRSLSVLTLVLLWVFQSTAWPQSTTPELVQISLAPKTPDPVWVGQRVSIIVEVLSPTFFAGPTNFTLPDIAGAVFYKPQERALVSSKTIDGKTYSVQRHEFSFYPQRAGDFEIPPFKVRFGIAGKPGEEATEHSEQTTALKISSKMPPGAEHLSVLISTSNLKVDESWNPQASGTVTVGDAFKRTITFRAPDMPGMVFPTINFPEVEGLKLYQSRATVNDKIDRGSLTGERIEGITYLCEKPGSYSLPAIAIPWWNLNKKQMQKIILPAVSFEVEPGNSSTSLADKTQNSVSLFPRKAVTVLSAFALIFAAVLFHFKNSILQQLTDWQTRRKESERAYFKKINEATSPARTLNAITAWLAHSEPNRETLSLHSFASEQNDPELTAQLEALQAAVVSQNSQWESTALINALRKTRQSAVERHSSPALQPLNPG